MKYFFNKNSKHKLRFLPVINSGYRSGKTQMLFNITDDLKKNHKICKCIICDYMKLLKITDLKLLKITNLKNTTIV